MNLVPYEEFCAFYEKEMAAKRFERKEKGENYLVFYNSNIKKHVGIMYDDVTKIYRFTQW
jgi:hypothetical protein